MTVTDEGMTVRVVICKRTMKLEKNSLHYWRQESIRINYVRWPVGTSFYQMSMTLYMHGF